MPTPPRPAPPPAPRPRARAVPARRRDSDTVRATIQLQRRGAEKLRVLTDTHASPPRGERPAPTSPFPEGWYFVESLDAIREAGLIEKVFLGRDIVAWCDGRGGVCVAGAYCPHLGSHLGPSVGGRVRDGCLVCPFHGFEYDIHGQCVATPGAPAPKNARLGVLETQEVAGMIFAWWSPVGRSPQWILPALEAEAWSPLQFARFRLQSHPEFTTENAVDMNHLAHVHGYHDARQLGRVTVDGAHLANAFEFKRRHRIGGIFRIVSHVSAVVHLYGLGYSFIPIHEKSFDFHGRLWVLVTPIDGAWMELVLAGQVREVTRPARFFAGLGFLPTGLRSRIYTGFMVRNQAHDVRDDIPIWNSKCSVPRPILNRLDGELMVFRRFCRQFYPTDAEAGTPEEPRRTVGVGYERR